MTRRTQIRTVLGILLLAASSLPGQLEKTGPRELAVGIVFAGGGSFGAFEVGALHAFFEQWQREHGSPPPVRVIAGTSAGALIAPFTALGEDGIREVTHLYRTAERKTVFSLRTKIVLPFALFARMSSSVYDSDPLARLLREHLPDEKLATLTAMWPVTRVVVLGTDYGSGNPVAYSNDPHELVQDDTGQGLARFRSGLLASASSPMTVAPVYIADGGNSPKPHLDGGVSAVAPFQAFFDLAAKAPEVALTHIVVISPYAPYPSADSGQAQQKPFPAKPNFAQISARTGTLLSESLFSKEVALVWSAVSLRNAGVSKEEVKERTSLSIGELPVDLILMAPDKRLGWDSLRFDRVEMEEMFNRGLRATQRHLLP